MKVRLSVLALTFALLAPAPAASAASSGERRSFTPAESLALGQSFDADLGALRAGGLDTPTRLSASERAQLQLAQEQSSGLEELRAGDDTTILLIVLVVLIVAILI